MVSNIFRKISLFLSQVVLFCRKTDSKPLVTKMTEEEVIKLAHDMALSEGWTWRGIIKTEKKQIKKGEKTPIYWRVTSNRGEIGCNVTIYIDDATGNILSKGFMPR